MKAQQKSKHLINTVLCMIYKPVIPHVPQYSVSCIYMTQIQVAICILTLYMRFSEKEIIKVISQEKSGNTDP